MADTRPAPLVPQDADLKDFAFTPIYRARLFGSAFHARASDAEWRAGVTLWLKSQDQKPAGSLPTDDVDLCRLAELGRDLKAWKKIKTMALHGWFECSDGRLYNQVVAEIVNEQWEGRRAHIERREKWREKKARQRGDSGDQSEGTAEECPPGHEDLSPGTSGDVPLENPLKGQGQGQGQGNKKDDDDTPVSGVARKPFDHATEAVIEASGSDPSKQAGWATASAHVAKWRQRFDFDLDVLPAIRGVMVNRAGRGPPDSPAYFDKAILEAHERRLRPLPELVNGGRTDGRTTRQNDIDARRSEQGDAFRRLAQQGG